MATERYRRNAISSLKDNNGDLVYDHHLMQGMIWSDFHNRMGTSQGIQLGFDLDDLIQPVDGLHELSAPFSDKEVESVIKEMPSDRAPRPDGFSVMHERLASRSSLVTPSGRGDSVQQQFPLAQVLRLSIVQ